VSEFKIEKNVAQPPKLSSKTVYPFRELDIGDSFEFTDSERYKISTAAYHFGKANQMKFSVRKTSATTARCWRIE